MIEIGISIGKVCPLTKDAQYVSDKVVLYREKSIK